MKRNRGLLEMKVPISSIKSIRALTLSAGNMAQSIGFYQAMGFVLSFGDDLSDFVTLHHGDVVVNLIKREQASIPGWWGRAILYVDDVDVFYQLLCDAGLRPEFAPRNGSWGERYFHIQDPEGHELSFAQPLS